MTIQDSQHVVDSTSKNSGKGIERHLTSMPLRFGSEAARSLRPMGLMNLLVLARQHRAIDLATGSPSFPETGKDLIVTACDAIQDGMNQYDATYGNADLRTVCAHIHDADPDAEITITSGASEGLNVVIQSLVDPGDEVIVIEPYCEAFPAAIRLAGAIPRFVPLRPPEWHWDSADLAAALSPRTKLIVINSPHNPTGSVLTTDDFAELAGFLAGTDVFCVSDETYVELVDYPGQAPVAWQYPALADRTVVLRSLSKSHAISGWRIGWIYASEPLTALFRMVHETITTGSVAPLQLAAARTLRRRPGWTDRERQGLMTSRNRLVAALRAAGLEGRTPQAGAFFLGRLPHALHDDSEQAARRLIEDFGIAAAPGNIFFADAKAGARYLRFSYNKAESIISAAAECLRGKTISGAAA